ncbi:MAG: rod shape-determining protein MreC [Coriobacteriales bacterium]|jgi:rod shape-determining protein MreC|nr:rod shape-determining protein MreC [Coriobacteriales bacterium]
MAFSPNKPRKLSGGILLIILCLLSVALMTVWAREGSTGPLHRVKNGVETIVMPIRLVGSLVTTPITALVDFCENVMTRAATVDALREQNEELQSLVIRMEEYRQENEQLSSLLNLKEAYNLDAVGARVISVSADSWNKVITINKGSIAGLEAGMPVLNASGLIGQVETVAPYSSVVRLITDEKSGVAAFLQETRAEGILSGSLDGILSLDFIPLGVPVELGDVVITSGTGGVYPKGIPIGEVVSVRNAPSDVYRTIIVRPVTRVMSYEEVLVVVGREAEITISDTPQNDVQGQGQGQGSNGGNEGGDQSSQTSDAGAPNQGGNGSQGQGQGQGSTGTGAGG